MLDTILAKIKKIIPKKLYKAIWPLYHFVLAWLGAIRYGWPSNKLIVIGVTGTTGKTTIVYLIAKMLAQAGYKVGYTSTAIFSDGNKDWLNDKKMSMPGRFFVQRMLNQMVKNGCQYAVVETTSEGIMQYRHRFINYDAVLFSGLYPEHIEAHGSFENYREAKGMLFAHLHDCKVKYVDEQQRVCKAQTGLKKIGLHHVKKAIIVNGNDAHYQYFADFWAEEKYRYQLVDQPQALRTENHFTQVDYGYVSVSSTGTRLEILQQKINLQLLGAFNAGNAAAAATVGTYLRLTPEQIKQGLQAISGVPGRLELINEGQNFAVIVDYAFEPNAVRKLYETIKLIPHEKVIHVLGSAGGGRDTARRPVLGKLAGQLADFVIVTNEDPYDDNPEIIVDQVMLGAEKSGKSLNDNLFKIMDRREAIAKALDLAGADDIVLLTGKGSEQAICVAGGKKIAWDDRAVVREELGKLKEELKTKN